MIINNAFKLYQISSIENRLVGVFMNTLIHAGSQRTHAACVCVRVDVCVFACMCNVYVFRPFYF